MLAAGVLRVEGRFAAGQAVRVCVIRGRWGRKEGVGSGTPEISRPGSPDHFEDRKKGVRGGREGEEDEDEEEDEEDEEGTEGKGEEGEDVLEFGRGLTNYNSSEIDRVKGLRR